MSNLELDLAYKRHYILKVNIKMPGFGLTRAPNRMRWNSGSFCKYMPEFIAEKIVPWIAV